MIDGANRHDSPLLRPTVERLARFGFDLPDQIRLHLDAGYDSGVARDLLDELGSTVISNPRARSCRSTTPEGINAIIIVRRLVREAWATHRWDTRTTRRR